MSTLSVSFIGIMCHYDMADQDRPNKNASDPPMRTIILDGSRFSHPHQAFLAVPDDLVLSDIGWPTPIQCELDGAPFLRYDLAGIRMRVLTNPEDSEDVAVPAGLFTIDPTFNNFVPPLGKVIPNFAPIDQDYVTFNPASPDLVAGHFDMRAGRLHVAEFDSYASSFDPAGEFPPGGRIPLASRLRLDIEVENGAPIELVGEFYKVRNRPKRRLILDPDVRRILIANVVPEDIGLISISNGRNRPNSNGNGNGHGNGDRTGHFELYSSLSMNSRQGAAIAVGSTRLLPETPGPDDRRSRGASGGCPGTNYPP
ncbi:MAG TPA: hypothetical protein VJ276_16170 [Thermoanaerobaculia bacterium]|nr:hypothetical protein [Thermoanaerobaculia bacterium]